MNSHGVLPTLYEPRVESSDQSHNSSETTRIESMVLAAVQAHRI
jgi:hypothetical protein